MSETIYFKRQNRLKEVLGDKGLDGMLITNLTNIRYICGFTGSAAGYSKRAIFYYRWKVYRTIQISGKRI